MKFYAINSSPRKNFNTAKILVGRLGKTQQNSNFNK